MEASGFDEANTTVGPPKGVTEAEVFSIRAHAGKINGTLVLTTCWQVTKEELDEITRTGRVWFTSWTVLTPHRLDGIKPDWVKRSTESE